MGLTGTIQKKIDSKGRISVPKKLRKFLLADTDSEITILRIDGCLQLYPTKAWSKLENKLEQLSPFAEKTRRLHRYWGMQSDQSSLDSEGRLTLTPDQKQYAGIDDAVSIIGAINTIEIWSAERLKKMTDQAPSLEDLADEIANSI